MTESEVGQRFANGLTHEEIW